MMTVDDMREALAHIEALDPDDRVDLEIALKRLPLHERQVLVLRAMGYTKREIAVLTGWCNTALMNRAERALMKELACDE